MLGFYKRNIFKIISICLLLICIGCSLLAYMSYRNAQGFVHDNAHIALFRTGILSFIVGYIGIVLTAFGYLLWVVWKCITTYVYRHK